VLKVPLNPCRIACLTWITEVETVKTAH